MEKQSSFFLMTGCDPSYGPVIGCDWTGGGWFGCRCYGCLRCLSYDCRAVPGGICRTRSGERFPHPRDYPHLHQNTHEHYERIQALTLLADLMGAR